MLTTIDNPWHPFTNFDEWMTYDHEMGYDTVCYLDRIANASEELSDNDYDAAILEGMKEICELNVLGIYKLIHKDDVIDLEKARLARLRILSSYVDFINSNAMSTKTTYAHIAFVKNRIKFFSMFFSIKYYIFL